MSNAEGKTVSEVKRKLEIMSRMADLLEGIEPDEAIRMFFSTLVLLGYDPNKVTQTVKDIKTSKAH